MDVHGGRCLRLCVLLIAMTCLSARASSFEADFATAAGSHPRVSSEGHWLAEISSQPMAVWLTPLTGEAAAPRELRLPMRGRLLWINWSRHGERLIVVAEQNTRPVVLAITPDTGEIKTLSGPDDQLRMSIASGANDYGFPVLRVSRAGRLLELGPDGEFIPSASGRLLCSEPACSGGVIDFSSQGSTQRYRMPSAEGKTLLALSAADRRQGSGLISITAEGEAWFLSSAGRDRLALVRIALDSGMEEVRYEGASDILGVSLDPVSHRPGFVETDDAVRRVVALDAPSQSALALLRRLGGGEPHLINRAPSDRFWLVSSPETPGAPRLAVLDRETERLRAIEAAGSAYRGRVAWRTGRGEQRSSDGLQVPWILLSPLACGPGACPLVVLLHGGPGVQDTGEVSPERQLLLERGYAILLINYRGSRGFGKAYEQLDAHQWFRGIPEDVRLTLHALQQAGTVHASRVAFMGTSFAAYLALNLIAEGEPVRCAVVDSGAMDLPAFVSESMAAAAARGGRSDLPERIGDPGIAAQALDMQAGSPSSKTDRLRHLPVLHMHGAQDSIVSVAQARQFAAQMRAASPRYRYIEFPDEGHGLTGARKAYWAAAMPFLERCLAP